jgi:site-specific DNA-cytosine methylase
MEDEGIVVLSLFDGMSAGQVALREAGIKVKTYYASEIDKYAIQVTMANFPNTIQLGDVSKIDCKYICLSEVYSYICHKYFNNDLHSLQSIISEQEMLHRIIQKQTFAAYFGTQEPMEAEQAQKNTSLRANDRVWFFRNQVGSDKGIYDIVRGGERRKTPNTVDVGELCKHSFWWNGNRQYESKTKEEGVGGIDRQGGFGENKESITNIGNKAVFDKGSEGYSESESNRAIQRSSEETELSKCDSENRPSSEGKEKTGNPSETKGDYIQRNTESVQAENETDGSCEEIQNVLSIHKEVQISVVTTEWGFLVFTGNFQLAIGGSPCQSFSFAGKQKGMATKCEQEILSLETYLELKAQDFEFEGQSYLFWEYMRIKHATNPDHFFLENVLMSEKWRKVLTQAIGINSICINSSLVSAQNRERLYWTNIAAEPAGLFDDLACGIKQPKDRGILLKDVLEKEVAEKYYLSDKMLNYLNTRKENYNGGKINYKTGEDVASCINASLGSLDISDNIIVDNPEEIAKAMGETPDKSYCLDATYYKGTSVKDYLNKKKHQLVHNDVPQDETEQKNESDDKKNTPDDVDKDNLIFTKNYAQWDTNGLGNKSQDQRAYYEDGKCGTLGSEGSHSQPKVIIESEDPQAVAMRGRQDEYGKWIQQIEPRTNGKTNSLTTVEKDNLIVQTGKIKQIGSLYGQHSRWAIYAKDGLSPTITASMGMGGGHVPMIEDDDFEVKAITMSGQFGKRKVSTSDKAYCLAANPSSDMQPMVKITKAEKQEEDITSGTLRTHKDGNGFREVKSATVPARAREDGSGQNVVKIMSRIRRLTPVECERLQTFPDYYTDKNISDTQRYKMLGNSWTVEVIKYIFGHLPYSKNHKN